MKKKDASGIRMLGLTDAATGNMVAFNIENAVFDINPKGHSTVHASGIEFNVETVELLTLLQGCQIELYHCQKQETQPEVQTPVQEMPAQEEVKDVE